ncbi:MAG: hypothetical protein BMS9Abin36_1979 [Gammaproteobacteria bacterium]|nr:MAG: hypothetical protein BMS9Abin36_1979 [Gammaproteobacteria bacterium]
MKMRNCFALVLLMSVSAVWVSPAQAIPAFARKYETPCTTCHTAWPKLNSFGRQFKENGYKFARGEQGKTQVISDFLEWDKNVPVTGIFVARPYDKKKSGDVKLRALHEIEILIAGVIYKDVSGYFELEAEDETGFEIELPHHAVSYHPFSFANVMFAYAANHWSDPYDTYADHRRMTRGHATIGDQAFGGADNGGKERNSHQQFSINGRPIKPLFYNVGVTGVAKDPEGEDPHTYFGRLTFDIMPDIMVGGMHTQGKCTTTGATGATGDGGSGNCLVNRNFTRTGVDVQADFLGARLSGVAMKATDDDATATNEVENTAAYVEGMYVFKNGGRPWIVPLVRADQYTKNDGKDDYASLTANVTYYYSENVKAYLEYWNETKRADNKDKDSRITLQILAAF